MLKWAGVNGWIDGVPARDLTDEEVKKYGLKRLLDSGLYIKVIEKSEVKNGNQGTTQNSFRG